MPSPPDPTAGAPAPGVPVPDVLRYLAGSWHVSRTVRDLATGASGVFEGTADFVPAGGDGSLSHLEEGAFTWHGATRPARREHRFDPAADGTALVRFADGRPFHPLDLRTGAFSAVHPCAEDDYRGRFTVLDADRWQVVWTVTGPAKSLLLATLHNRIGPPRSPVYGRPDGPDSTRLGPLPKTP